MTVEIVFVIWQCVHLTLSMAGWANFTNQQLFFPLVCLIVAIAVRVYLVYKQRLYHQKIQQEIREIDEMIKNYERKKDNKEDN